MDTYTDSDSDNYRDELNNIEITLPEKWSTWEVGTHPIFMVSTGEERQRAIKYFLKYIEDGEGHYTFYTADGIYSDDLVNEDLRSFIQHWTFYERESQTSLLKVKRVSYNEIKISIEAYKDDGSHETFDSIKIDKISGDFNEICRQLALVTIFDNNINLY